MTQTAPTGPDPSAARAAAPPVGAKYVAVVALAVLVRPELWAVGLRQMLRLAEPRWWSRLPMLPVPPSAYLHFRMVTAYGGGGSCSTRQLTADVLTYLRWCRSAGDRGFVADRL